MPKMRYVILQQNQELQFVEMPEEYAYQLSALNLRLNKEIDKLTADNVPDLPLAIAECDSLDLLREDYSWSPVWIISIDWNKPSPLFKSRRTTH